jgi:hypothetical protein
VGYGDSVAKTEAAKAWCWALWKLRKSYSVAISASKVEALCEIKRGLMDLGVPEAAIGLSHSYTYDAETVARYQKAGEQLPNGLASLPKTTDNELRPIVLLTHNKIRGQREGDRLPKFNGKPRSLLIYDESLLISDTWSLSMVKLHQAKGWLEPLVTSHLLAHAASEGGWGRKISSHTTLDGKNFSSYQSPTHNTETIHHGGKVSVYREYRGAHNLGHHQAMKAAIRKTGKASWGKMVACGPGSNGWEIHCFQGETHGTVTYHKGDKVLTIRRPNPTTPTRTTKKK